MLGWIKLYRSIQENEMYFSERFSKMQAWIDLLLLANHRASTVFIRGIEIRLKPGQLCYSQESLAKRWKWNRKTVSIYLSMLSRREMLDIKISRVTTVISLRNWDLYQMIGQLNGQQKGNKTETDKNGKKEKNVFVAALAKHLDDNGIDFDEYHLTARITRALENYDEKQIREAVNDAMQAWRNNGHAGNFVSYLFRVLENNYARSES